MAYFTLTLPGREMAYAEAGEGTPLVLLHGSLADHRYWSAQMAPFSQKFRTLAPSLPQYWPAKWNGVSGEFTVGAHADAVAAFLRAMGLPPAHVVGHSRGGRVALELALRHPELLGSLTLADPQLQPASGVPSGNASPVDRGVAEAGRPLEPRQDTSPSRGNSVNFREQAAKLVLEGKVEEGMALFLDSVAGVPVWQRLNSRRRAMVLDNAMTLVGQMRDATPAPSADDVQALSMPVLLLNGERSSDDYHAATRWLAGLLPHARHSVIPKAGHGMNAENITAFNDVVLDFLAAVDAKRRFP